MDSSSPIRVMVVDDHAITRNGITAFVKAHTEFTLVGEAENGAEAVALCNEVQPDVVLMDLLMPIMDGTTATRMIRQRHPQVAILILTCVSDGKMLTEAVAGGATGYVLKNDGIQDVAAAILAVYRGDPYFSPESSQLLVKAVMQREQQQIGDDLTQRESDVLQLITQGYTNRQIAARLNIAPATAKFHVGNILSKLHVQSRTEAVIVAVRHQLVSSAREIVHHGLHNIYEEHL